MKNLKRHKYILKYLQDAGFLKSMHSDDEPYDEEFYEEYERWIKEFGLDQLTDEELEEMAQYYERDDEEDEIVDPYVTRTDEQYNTGGPQVLYNGSTQSSPSLFSIDEAQRVASVAGKLDKMGEYDLANECDDIIRVLAMSKQEALGVLGLSSGASDDEILNAYKQKALEFHPDRGGDVEQMKLINVARDSLLASDPKTSDDWDFGSEEFDKAWQTERERRDREYYGRGPLYWYSEIQNNRALIEELSPDRPHYTQHWSLSDDEEETAQLIAESKIKDLWEKIEGLKDKYPEEYNQVMEYERLRNIEENKKEVFEKEETVVILEEEYGYRYWYWFPKMSPEKLEEWWMSLQNVEKYFFSPASLPGDVINVPSEKEDDWFDLLSEGNFYTAHIHMEDDSWLRRPDGSVVENEMLGRQPGSHDNEERDDIPKLSYQDIKSLVLIANSLDQRQLYREAGDIDKLISDVIKGKIKTKKKKVRKERKKEKDKQGNEALVRSNGRVGTGVTDNQNAGAFQGFSDAYMYSGYGNLEGAYGPNDR